MKKYFPALVLFVSLAFAACAQTRQTTNTKPVATVFTWLRMEHTACFGRCPVYSITLYPDGKVLYYGRRNVSFLGTYSKTMNASLFTDVFRKAELSNLDTCKDKYMPRAADLPGVMITYVKSGVTRRIINANYGPMFLRDITKMIDDLVKVDSTWTKVSDAIPED